MKDTDLVWEHELYRTAVAHAQRRADDEGKVYLVYETVDAFHVIPEDAGEYEALLVATCMPTRENGSHDD